MPFDITLPLQIYPPAKLDPPKVDLFVFFHGMRADYGEVEGERQGSEPIALWSHLREAVAGTDRLGIAPQAPQAENLFLPRDTMVEVTALELEKPGKTAARYIAKIKSSVEGWTPLASLVPQ